jgi:DNA-binding MarR family transcriptional regulator
MVKATQTLEQRTFVLVMRAHDLLAGAMNAFLRPHGLTTAQYNVLRILRGAGPDGLPCQEISARMIARVPDITRLLDRLERAGLVARQRAADDRRRVITRISAEGLALLERLDDPIVAAHAAQFVHLDRDRLVRLHDGLDDLLRERDLGAGPTAPRRHDDNPGPAAGSTRS